MIERKTVIESAKSLLGTKFRHQGRNPKTGIDCVGFLISLAHRSGYKYEVFDNATYRRVPDERIAQEYLRMNMTEITKDEIKAADIMSMMCGNQESHVGVKIDDERFIHARAKGFSGSVQIDYIKDWIHLVKRGYRLKGIVD